MVRGGYGGGYVVLCCMECICMVCNVQNTCVYAIYNTHTHTHKHTQAELAASKASIKTTLGEKEHKINELVEELGTTQAMLNATQEELSLVRVGVVCGWVLWCV